MRRLLMLLLTALLLLACAGAEETEIPTLPGRFPLEDLPKNMTFTVYTGPGKEYYIANDGKAKVSTNAVISCYGRVDEEWLLILYEVGGGRQRIGYIHPIEQLGYTPQCRRLTLAEAPIQMKKVYITDDPYGRGEVIGNLAGNITVLAQTFTGNWVYVEGPLENGQWARGFVKETELSRAELSLDLPRKQSEREYLTRPDQYELNLPKDALAEGMSVYPLADGSYLIAYHCAGSDRLWMRVISDTGKKLFAKSVPELYLSQITLTDTGFICQTFDNSEIDSGMRYTYTCKGKKWTSRKVSWIDEADRFYSDNMADYTVRRYVFCEGSVFPVTVTSLATGAEAEHRMTSYPYSYQPFLYELEGKLLLCGGDETGAYTLRIYDDQAQELQRIPMPEGMPAQSMIASATHDDAAVYFYTGYGSDWQRWRLDRAAVIFDPAPVNVAVPTDCSLRAVDCTEEYHLVLMDTDFTSVLCHVTAEGELQQVWQLYGRAVWSENTAEGFRLLIQDDEGAFILQRYVVNLY